MWTLAVGVLAQTLWFSDPCAAAAQAIRAAGYRLPLGNPAQQALYARAPWYALPLLMELATSPEWATTPRATEARWAEHFGALLRGEPVRSSDAAWRSWDSIDRALAGDVPDTAGWRTLAAVRNDPQAWGRWQPVLEAGALAGTIGGPMCP